MQSAARLAVCTLSMMAGMGLPALAQADTQAGPPDRDQPSRTHTVQISEDEARSARDKAAGKAYLDNATDTPPPPTRPDAMQTEGDQISQGSGKAPASQITDSIERSPSMAQLSRADLDATLAQLSAAERRVLLQAIEGTDICDNPPNVAAVITLCQSRLETRSVGVGSSSSLRFFDSLRGELVDSSCRSIYGEISTILWKRELAL
jgi:hypothetical protein